MNYICWHKHATLLLCCLLFNAAFSQTTVLPKAPNANPLEGVDVYDLVLISKHILGIQRLDSPYKIIAADANKSRTLTKFDVITLGKLILGVYDSLPYVGSFRYIPKNYIFENPNNPLNSVWPEKGDKNTLETEFLCIKIGDVNNTVIGDYRPETPSTETALAYGALAAHSGTEFEVPVFANQNLKQIAWQMALHYDPARLQLLDVRWPATLGAFQDRDWHEPRPGEIRLLWYDGAGAGNTITNGTPLFYLKFKSLVELTDPALALDGGIPNLSYSATGEASALQLRGADVALCRREEPAAALAPVSWSAEVYPNPAGDHFRVDISVPEATSCHIVIFDMLGRSCWEYKSSLNTGLNTFNQTPNLPAGQYLLQCDTDLGRKTLRFEKR